MNTTGKRPLMIAPRAPQLDGVRQRAEVEAADAKRGHQAPGRRRLGPPEVLTIAEQEAPVASPGRVVVDVHAAGVNYVDALFVSGQYQIKPVE